MMLINSGLKLNEEKLQMFENELKVKLPVDYKEFMLAHNGGMPEDDLMFNYHNSVNNKESRSLIQMFYIIYEEENYEIYNLKNICFTLWNDKALTKDYLAIAEDPAGNYVCISLNAETYGNIYFCNHEYEDAETGTLLMVCPPWQAHLRAYHLHSSCKRIILPLLH